MNMHPVLAIIIAAIIAAPAGASAQQPAAEPSQPATVTKDSDLTQILERLRIIEARLAALERRLGPDEGGTVRAQGEQMVLEARAKYRAAQGQARAEYAAKKTECDKLESKERRACIDEARAARSEALSSAKAALRKVEDESFALSPGLREKYKD